MRMPTPNQKNTGDYQENEEFKTTYIASNWLPSALIAEEINTTVSDIRIQEYKHVISQNTQEMDLVNAELDKLSANFENLCEQYTPLIANDTDRRLLAEIRTDWDNYLSEGEKMIELSSQNKTQEAMAVMNSEHLTHFNDFTAKCQELMQFNKTGSDQANEQADIAYAFAQKTTLATLTALTIIAILFAVYIVCGITKPVSEIDSGWLTRCAAWPANPPRLPKTRQTPYTR
ncbi:MCP four helix bundle domain-containing protein [Enterocloster aldenensis]|jgi:methyl-accepting chemotaxis protein|uniref:MCP four helix bundle domain-containing protein n=2 Tax=Enterocloster aldenensis TaxID=358742 RepID=UPI002FE6DF34